MRTLLSQFCEEFESRVRPVLDPLVRATETLGEASTNFPVRQILPGLRERRHQLQVLADKVAEQQAYVLIFGPLKSGKSTLMNAMTGAYVSEVTSLPAYPCLSYVSHADSREFEITRYDGRTEKLSDPAALRMVANRAHKELADKIREIEGDGVAFDPAIHFPEAIRRIDVRVPAGDLRDSGAVLVDTPGLYSRMKFGYDKMTRAFRDTAACAVFVVKSDNLFLDQVFAEFNELLDLFSRIFLVVNLDSAKKDLRPDGTLGPSLESEDPFRIIEAFENLSMNAPLKAAADEGRLRIYPVDLLRAASQRMRAHIGAPALPGVDEEPPGETAHNAAPDTVLSNPVKQADFDAFLNDLTDYLNSTDYLVAFLGDSLRVADNVLRETAELCRHESVQDLGDQVAELETESRRVQSQARVLARLHAFDWTGAFAGLEERVVAAQAGSRSDEIKERTGFAVAGAVDKWFRNGHSLQQLTDADLAPLLTNCQKEIIQALTEELRSQVLLGPAGVHLPSEVQRDLETVGIRLESLGRLGVERVDGDSAIASEVPALRADEVPVKKRFWDWLLFRSPVTVSRKIFGHPNPSKPVPKSVKAKRLGPGARQAILDGLERHFVSFFPQATKRLAQRIFRDYSEGVITALQEDLGAKQEANEQRQAYLQQRLEELGRIQNQLSEMETGVRTSLTEMEKLAAQYRETDPRLLQQPLEEEDEQAEAPERIVVEPLAEEDDAEVESEAEREERVARDTNM